MSVYLDDLLISMKEAALETNHLVGQQHLRGVTEHWHRGEDGVLAPQMLQMRLPATVRQEGAERDQVLDIPVAALCQSPPLFVEELDLCFDCSLTGIERNEDSGERRLALLLGDSAQRSASKARVTVQFKSGANPEGLERINDLLLKKIG